MSDLEQPTQMNASEQRLEIAITDGRLQISIGVKTLAGATSLPESHWDITDVDGFARDVLAALLDEQEDGTTLVHEMFDSAAEKAIDDGSDAVRITEADDTGDDEYDDEADEVEDDERS